MSQYQKLDQLILGAVSGRRSPLYDNACIEEADRLAKETGREGFRVIDIRLQALRKAGKIYHTTKARSNGAGGWHVNT